MALVQTSLIWVTCAIALAVLLVLAATFVLVYQARRDHAASVTAVSILTTTAVLATVLLLPVDVALVSSTNAPAEGRRVDWATPDEVEGILYTLKVVYYTLYSLDAVLCLLVVPFTYFWYEELDPDGQEDGTQTVLSRMWGAFKYTLFFIALVVILFLVGFFIPHARKIKEGKNFDLDYFKKLLEENHGERALTFALGLLITIGTFVYVIYTGSGLALLPVALIKSAPAISAPSLAVSTAAQLEHNRERQRQLEARNEGRPNGLDSRDRRELEALRGEERTLVRRERVAAEARGEGQSLLVRAWHRLEAVLRPVKLLGGLLLLALSLLVAASMLVTGVDKARHSACGARCGYILGATRLFQPVNALLVLAARAFPADYVLLLLLVVYLVAASAAALAVVGIRVLWVVVFRVRRGRTSPQALLLATVLLALVGLAVDYAVVTMVAPRYAIYGAQTYCDREPKHPGEQPDCSGHRAAIKPCSEMATNKVAQYVCTPSVASTFINRMTANFPFFGVVDFWAQFAFLGVFLLVFVVTLFRTPKFDMPGLDADLEDDEEEGLLASTGRRFNTTWEDITGRSKRRVASYGATDGGGDEEAAENGGGSSGAGAAGG